MDISKERWGREQDFVVFWPAFPSETGFHFANDLLRSKSDKIYNI